MISGIQKISVYNPANGVVVQLNKISGGDFTIKEPLESKNVDGQLIYDGHKSFVEFASYDDTGFDQLESWMIAKTPVRLVAAGVEQNLLWYESSPITVRKNYLSKAGSRNFFTVRIAKEKGTHSIHLFANLLRSGGKWEDANTDGLADLFTKIAPISHQFSATVQTLYGTNGNNGSVRALFEFPISGLPIYGRVNKTLHIGNDITIFMAHLNFAGSIITSASGENIALTTPALTYKINYFIDINVTDPSNEFNFRLPYVGLKRSTYSNINF